MSPPVEFKLTALLPPAVTIPVVDLPLLVVPIAVREQWLI